MTSHRISDLPDIPTTPSSYQISRRAMSVAYEGHVCFIVKMNPLLLFPMVSGLRDDGKQVEGQRRRCGRC